MVAVGVVFVAMAVAFAVEPVAFEESAVWHDFAEVAVWLTVFERTFFDAAVVPAASAGAGFFLGVVIDLAEVIVISIFATDI